MKWNTNIAGVAFAALVVAASADTVSTSDGSRIVGRIERIAGGKIVLLTDIAGRLEIDTSKVTGLSTEGVVSVEFASGDTLVGSIVQSADPGGALVRSALGDIPISVADITLLWPEGSESPNLVATREEARAHVEALKPKWSTVLEAGATFTEGNTETLKGHGRLDVKRTTQDDLLHFYLAARYDEQDDKRTTNEYLGGAIYEMALARRWFWYARTELEFDEFEDLDLRATAAGGAGYHWLKQPGRKLKTTWGAGYRHESYDTERTEDDAVVDLGLDYRIDVGDWGQFTHAATYSPDIEDIDNYRLKFDTALTFPLKNDRWSWKLGVRNEYNSQPQPGLERLDNTFYTSIVLKLK